VPAVAALGAILVALMALLLIYALEVLGKILAHMFPTFIPGVPGVNPRTWIEAGVGVLQDIIQWIIGDVIRPMIGLVVRPVIAVFNFIGSLERFVTTASLELEWLATTAIPEALAAARHYAHGLYVAAEHYARRIVDAAAHELRHLIDLARSYAHSLYVAAEHYARRIVDASAAALTALITAAHTYAHDLYVASEHYARRIVDASAAELTNAIHGVEAEVKAMGGVSVSYVATQVADAIKASESYTADAVAGVITVVDVDAIHGLAAAWPGLIDDVGALVGVIGTDLPDIGAAVRAIPRDIPADLAGALTAVGAISIPMLRYMARCGVPNCRNLSQLGRDLAELATAVEAGAFLALLVGLAADPIGTAHWLTDNVGGLATDAVDSARSLLGV
jgi:hypothetical protein